MKGIKGFAAALGTALAVVVAASGSNSLSAQDEGGDWGSLKIQVQRATRPTATDEEAAKKYGYVTARGAFAPEGENGGQGLLCFRKPPSTDKFFKVRLEYVDFGQIGGFFGSYYKVKASGYEFQILFSDNPDIYGHHHVFYLDMNGQVLVDYAATRCPRAS